MRRSIVFGFMVGFLFSTGLSAQDLFPIAPDSSKRVFADSSLHKEIALEDIHIEAVIEKPSVTLIPKRTETEVGSIPFVNRSFDKELKDKPLFLDDYGEELESGKRIEKIKKVLAKESK